MVNFCIAIGCTHCAKPGSGISFHVFPHKNSELLQKWIQAVKRKNWVPNKYSLICSDYFEPSCSVVRPGKVGHRLYDNSVPTIYPSFPVYYWKEQRKRKLSMKRVYVSPQSPVNLHHQKLQRWLEVSNHMLAPQTMQSLGWNSWKR